MGNYIKAIIIILILMFFITFGVKNSQPLQLSYYFDFFNFSMPLYGLIYISILIGILMGMAVGLSSRYRMRKKLKHLEGENRVLEEKIKSETKIEKEDIEVTY